MSATPVVYADSEAVIVKAFKEVCFFYFFKKFEKKTPPPKIYSLPHP